MPQKDHILDVLGEQQLLLPGLINAALAANDRVKYYFSLLQLALAHAERPEAERPDLKGERSSAGEGDSTLDEVIAGTVTVSPGRYRLPHADAIAARIETALREMLAPFEATNDPRAVPWAERLASCLADSWLADGLVDSAAIARMTTGTRDTASVADSLHVLVMELHRALNALQASIASENIDGALAYGLDAADSAHVAAFMRGVNSTRALKFDHPGLATTATRAGNRLVLQNDIGTTDAHVLVVHVEERTATLTYTDVHLPRLMFLQSLLKRWNVEWNDTRSKSDVGFEDGIYHLAIGRFRAASTDELDTYLAWLGSRLAFLIDWNRARKRLRMLVRKSDAVKLLRWAAENDVGHMAFLRIGAEQAVFDALDSLGKAPSAFGARLDDVLGRDGAVEFLRFALRISAEMLVANQPVSLVLDELRGELFGRIHSVQQTALDHASEQMALTLEIASGVRDCLLNAGLPGAAERFAKNAERAKRWEHLADGVVNTARDLAQHNEQAANVCRIVESSDDIADELEDAAFHLTLLRDEARANTLANVAVEALTELAGQVVEGAQEYIKAVEAARVVRRGVPRGDVQDFFESVHRIVQIERQSDDTNRKVKTAALSGDGEPRALFVLAEISRNLEAAADALMHAALMLRDHVLKQVMAA
jgi:uncharacterized protein Yka (UPF0111/DUF47 family)